MDSNEISELKRLHFENVIWIVFAGLCVLNILGDNDEIFYIERNDVSYKNEANTIFELTLTMTFFIYLYFFNRNFKQLNKASSDKKALYEVKVLGSIFLISGIICLIYFQKRQTSFEGSPALRNKRISLVLLLFKFTILLY